MLKLKLIFFGLLIISLTGVFIVVNSVMETPVFFMKSFKMNISYLLPQGWAFFTRDAREERTMVFKLNAKGVLERVNLPGSDIRYLFGLDRSGRKIASEYIPFFKKIDSVKWKPCNYDLEDIARISQLSIPIEVDNYYVNPKCCGDLIFIRTYIKPWAWSSFKNVKMPSKIIRLMYIVKRINSELEQVINCLINKNIYTIKLGIARSVLACGTLLTLLFNKTNSLLMDTSVFSQLYDTNVFVLQNLNFFKIFSENYIYLAKYLAIFILLLVLIGWRPRYTCILHFWVCISFNYVTSSIEGGDQIVSNLSLMLIPILLLDNRRWHWQEETRVSVDKSTTHKKNLIANFVHVIIMLQMSFIYLHAAVAKMSKPDWANGTAMYYWLNDPIFGMSDWLHPITDAFLSTSIGVALFTWGTIVLELLLFMAIIMSKRSQFILLILGILFHFLIIVYHGLFSFYFAMAGGLLLYLWIDNPYPKYFRNKNK